MMTMSRKEFILFLNIKIHKMTKGDLAKLVLTEEEQKHFDFALPQAFVDECIHMGFDPRFTFIWDYNHSINGEPLDLAEKFFRQYRNTPRLVSVCIGLIRKMADIDPKHTSDYYKQLIESEEILKMANILDDINNDIFPEEKEKLFRG